MDKKSKQKLKAFVLMPFDQKLKVVFNKLIKPTLEEAGYDVKRADSIISQQNILKDVIRGIAMADLVVADLTGLNPNVFYELGISHALLKPTLLIAQSIDKVPFDLRSYRITQYSIHFDETPKFCEELKKRAEKAKLGKLEYGNPVSDFLQERDLEHITVYKTAIDAEEKLKIEEEKGLWDFVALGEESMENIKECTERITRATKEIGEKMQKRTLEAQNIQQSRAPGMASRMHRLTKATAMDMTFYGKKLEEEQPKLHDAWELYVENATGFAQTVSIKTNEEKEAARKFRSSMDELQKTNKNALGALHNYQEAIEGLKGISQDINRAFKRIAGALDLIIIDFAVADSYCTKVISLLNEKIEPK